MARLVTTSFLFSVFAVAGVLTVSFALDQDTQSQKAERYVLFQRTYAPGGWELGERAEGSEDVRFIVAMRQSNLNVLDDLFNAVSDPRSPQYQQYMSIEEINSLLRPNNDVVATVQEWLNLFGISEVEDLGDAFACKTTAAVAEAMFDTSIHVYHHHQAGLRAVKSYGRYSVPLHLRDAVHMIGELGELPEPRPKRRVRRPEPMMASAAGSGMAATNHSYLVPQTAMNMYSMPTSAVAGNYSIAVGEWGFSYFNPADLAGFGQQVGIDVPRVYRTVGDNKEFPSDLESSMDIEWASSLASGAKSWFWVESATMYAWMYTFAVHMLNSPEVPEIVSISYGWAWDQQCLFNISGTDCEQLGVNSSEYIIRVNTEFQKIGLRGVSLLVASGDSGTNSRSDLDCNVVEKFIPEYPSSSPYITSVGGTQLINARMNLHNPPPVCGQYPCASGGTETAVSYDLAKYTSGGGFSWVAGRPDWQAEAVDEYLRTAAGSLPPSSYYNGPTATNVGGRAFPDVAALGNNNIIFLDGKVSVSGGTSASTPIFSAVIALLNNASKRKNGKTLGFLNPLLYSMPESAFNDIVVGDNSCTENGCKPACKGFKAARGWDPVTGRGTPNFPAMLKYVESNYATGVSSSEQM